MTSGVALKVVTGEIKVINFRDTCTVESLKLRVKKDGPDRKFVLLEPTILHNASGEEFSGQFGWWAQKDLAFKEYRPCVESGLSSLLMKGYTRGGTPPNFDTFRCVCKTMFFLINRPWDLHNRIVRGRIIWKNPGEISVGGF